MNRTLINAIIAVLRRIGYRNVTRAEAFKRAHKARGVYECELCHAQVKRQDLHGDHIEPVIEPEVGFVDFNTYINRLFLGKIQAICKPCHKAKSKAENEIRRKRRNQDADDNWEESK